MRKINNFLSMTIANSSGNGITAVFWFIIAALLLPAEYGEIQYFISIAGLAYIISLLGNQTITTVYTAKKIPLQSTLTLISLVTGGVSAVIILFMFMKFDVSLLVIAFIINDIGIGYLLGKKFFVNYSKYFLTQKSLTFALGIILYFVLGPDGIILGIVLSYSHFIIIIFKIMKSSQMNFKILKTRWEFVTTSYSFNLVSIARNHLDKIIVLPLLGFELLGNYALALQMYALFMIFSKIIYNYTLPHDSVGESTVKIKIIAIILSIIIMTGGLLLTPIVFPIIFPQYIDAVVAIQIISLAVIPGTLSLTLSSKFLGDENARVILISRIGFAAVFIVLIVILTPMYGIIGSSGSFVIASIAQTIILSISNRK
jgi:O-antigen/teichoic acid export membrane protein